MVWGHSVCPAEGDERVTVDAALGRMQELDSHPDLGPAAHRNVVPTSCLGLWRAPGFSAGFKLQPSACRGPVQCLSAQQASAMDSRLASRALCTHLLLEHSMAVAYLDDGDGDGLQEACTASSLLGSNEYAVPTACRRAAGRPIEPRPRQTRAVGFRE
ncbi:hypothetical protein BS50DRAFT_580772 [Corynespora cassiicola Philippines]|uniref:Uncharacterized protein n=1 Tax=Corynespora cassiicola Philippines TaxID=1448308 RepID=A0A2T2P8D1_CORCC|nr:hypothetical protein BS50DRAFT_580772 [Corynespora cassiicola Philippines]